MTKFPSEEQERFIVRMPDGMRDQLREAAAKNKRSMNAEIVARLEDSLGGIAFVLPSDLRRRVEAAARLNHRQVQDELWHGLATLYPKPAEDDFAKMREVWDALIGGMPEGVREEASEHLKALIKKHFPDGSDYIDDLETRKDEPSR